MTTSPASRPRAEDIPLPTPFLPEQATLVRVLQQRRSAREFRPDRPSMEIIAGLLWAAFGINRPDTGQRTAPSARNWQEVDIYAVMEDGAYRYDPQASRLQLVKSGDLRALTGLQDFVAHAPLNLVYVVDFERMQDAAVEDREFFAGTDSGVIVQNVYLYCAAAGLATVVRAMVDRKRLAEALGLRSTQRIALAQSVGYPVT